MIVMVIQLQFQFHWLLHVFERKESELFAVANCRLSYQSRETLLFGRLLNAPYKSDYGHLQTMLSNYLLYKWNNLPFIGSV